MVGQGSVVPVQGRSALVRFAQAPCKVLLRFDTITSFNTFSRNSSGCCWKSCFKFVKE